LTPGAGPGGLLIGIHGDAVTGMTTGCGAPADELGWKDAVPVLPSLDFAPFVAGDSLFLDQARDVAWLLYLGLRCATEAVPGDDPCPFGTQFEAAVNRAVDQCQSYGNGALESRPEYQPGRHGPVVVPLDRACNLLKSAVPSGPVITNRRWRTAATEAKLALATIPTLPPRLRIGAPAVVNTHSEDRMIVREEPGLDAAEITRVHNGTGFIIEAGPVAADGKYWWRFGSGGWAAEENLEYPTPGVAVVLPLNTRTGIESVDRALEAIEADDPEAMLEAVHWSTMPCVVEQPSGIAPPPLCVEGEADGTVVEVLPRTDCEGVFARREGFEFQPIDGKRGLYAIARFPQGPSADGLRRARYRIYFVNLEAGNLYGWGSAWALDAEGIIGIEGGCATRAERLVPDDPAAFIVPPIVR
jgi:hypothetical protein